MTKNQAKEQIEVFLEQTGNKDPIVFEDKNFTKTTIGDAILGFIYNDDETLSCQSLIYRFRNAPKLEVMEAIEIESETAETGGGEIAFDEDNFTLLLQKNYQEKISKEDFYNEMQALAKASNQWSSEVLQRVANRAIPQ